MHRGENFYGDAAYRLDREPRPRGFALRKDGRVVGYLHLHHQELVATLNHLDSLAQSPRTLAAVLEAAGVGAPAGCRETRRPG